MSSKIRQVRAAVVGCGAIAMEHLKYLGASSKVRLVGVCDSSRATARFAYERFKAEDYYTNFDQMLAEAGPELIHVLTPPNTHEALVKASLDHGADVICEKPMTGSARETDDLLGYAAAKGRILIESRNLLFNDPVLHLQKLVRGGELGSVREIDILLSLDLTAGPFGDLNLAGPGVTLPAGAVHDFLPHLAYLFLQFVGHSAPIEDVVGYLENRSGNRRVGFDHLDALVRADGATGRLRINSTVKPDAFRLIVRGTKGSAETDLYNPFLRVEGGVNIGKRAPLEQIGSGLKLARAGLQNFRNKVLQHGTYHGMQRMLEEIYSAILNGDPPPISPQDIGATSSLVERIVSLGADR